MKSIVCLLALLSAQQTADLTWKPAPGTEARYSMTMTSTMNMGQGPADLIVKMKLLEKVKEVTDTSVTIESQPSDMTVNVNGADMDQGMTQQPVVTYKRGRDTMPLLEAQDQSPMARTNRGVMASVFPRPTKALAVGESHRWTVKGDDAKGTVDAEGKITLKGEEKLKGIDCWKLDYVYAENVKDQPTSAIGTLWLSKLDGTLVRSVMDLENFKSVNMMPPSAAHVVLELVTTS